jgi:hypothetical protein
MVQKEQGLVVRGLLVLAAVGGLVAFVLTLMFRPTHAQPPTLAATPEYSIPSVFVPSPAGFPSAISWYSVFQLGETLPSAPGWNVRYNAALTLARRGSPSVPWDSIREMLDEKQQMRNHCVRLPDGRDVYDETTARAFVVSAVRAVAAWHEQQKSNPKREVPTELRAIYAIVDKLTESEFDELKEQAEKARTTFFR